MTENGGPRPTLQDTPFSGKRLAHKQQKHTMM